MSDAQIRDRAEWACGIVLGSDAAGRIIEDQGLRWAVVAAMAACMKSHGSEVKIAIDDFNNAIQKRA